MGDANPATPAQQNPAAPENPPPAGQPVVKSEPMDTQPAQTPAAQQPAAQQSAGQEAAKINKREQERILNELVNLVARAQKTKKETKEEKTAVKLQAVAGALLANKLEFKMKVDDKAKKLTMECTNLGEEIKNIHEALRAAKRMGRGRGRGRGRRGGRSEYRV